MHTTERVLMVVKTYPTPSADHGETVCTAGIRLRDGAWVRIYPFPFRLADLEAKFKKWQVIEVPLTKATKDPRPESYKLHDVTSIKLGEEIGTENTTWSTRMKHIEPTIMPSVEAVLNGIPPKGDQNWGPTIRPVEIQTTGAQFSAEYVGEAWTPKEQAKLDKAEQLALGSLFQTAPRDLSRVWWSLSSGWGPAPRRPSVTDSPTTSDDDDGYRTPQSTQTPLFVSGHDPTALH